VRSVPVGAPTIAAGLSTAAAQTRAQPARRTSGGRPLGGV